MSTQSYDLSQRLEFYGLSARHDAVLGRISRHVSRFAPGALGRFYERVARTPEARRFFSTPDQMQRARTKQLAHWQALFSNDLDDDYMARAQRIGAVHAQINLDTKLYFGAYAQILGELLAQSFTGSWLRWLPGVRRRTAMMSRLVKVSLLDMDVAVTAIFETKEQQQRDVIAQVGDALAQVAQGRLCTSISDLPEDYAQLAADFDNAMTSLREMIAAVACSFDAIRTGTAEISDASDNLARRTEQQAASLEETAEAIRRLTGVVHDTAAQASGARDAASTANGDAESGGQTVQGAIHAMSSIEKSSSEIEQIVDVIDGIAFQTNLLALNAGVEAARAGDAGQGFAVVANEVRALAQRSADAAKDIKALITQSTVQVRDGVQLVGQTGTTFEHIIDRVKHVAGQVVQIAAQSTDQAGSIEQVNVAILDMDRMTQQNAAMVEQTSAAARNLLQQAEILSEMVGKFDCGKTGGQAQAPAWRQAAA